MTTKKRRLLSPEQKVVILRRHLLEHIPVSDLCTALYVTRVENRQ